MMIKMKFISCYQIFHLNEKDLEISDVEIGDEIKNNTVKTISESGKKQRDFTKYSFDGEELAKNRYIYAVIKNYVEENQA